MRIYYDFEFLEDGTTIDPISVGMVAEDGRSFYGVFQEIQDDPLYGRICRHLWLMTNVIPHLPLRAKDGLTSFYVQNPGFCLDLDDNRIMPKRMIRNAVREFIRETPDPELWAWYAAYDHVALAQLWGAMVDLPEVVPMWTNDLRQEQARLGDPPLPEQSGYEHNALDDARYCREIGEFLRGYTESGPGLV